MRTEAMPSPCVKTCAQLFLPGYYAYYDYAREKQHNARFQHLNRVCKSPDLIRRYGPHKHAHKGYAYNECQSQDDADASNEVKEPFQDLINGHLYAPFVSRMKFFLCV